MSGLRAGDSGSFLSRAVRQDGLASDRFGSSGGDTKPAAPDAYAPTSLPSSRFWRGGQGTPSVSRYVPSSASPTGGEQHNPGQLHPTNTHPLFTGTAFLSNRQRHFPGGIVETGAEQVWTKIMLHLRAVRVGSAGEPERE